MTPQAYFANGPVLRQGDARLPEGVVLPEGWTLRPMALAPQPGSAAGPPATGTAVSTTAPADSQPQAEPAAGQTSPAPSQAVSGPTAGPSSKAAEPSSLESSWSFGNTPGSTDAEGSSSAVAGSSSGGQNVTKRTVTVEDAEDESR
jgi:E3 ubiquitin-protein ligase synoviolin